MRFLYPAILKIGSIILLFTLAACGSEERKPHAKLSISPVSTSQTDITHPVARISDGETEHPPILSEQEEKYHASRGVSTAEEAYLEGYDDGYEDGEEDGATGVDYGLSFDPDHEFRGVYAESYEAGYEDGYHDGYHTNYKTYIESEDREEEDEED